MTVMSHLVLDTSALESRWTTKGLMLKVLHTSLVACHVQEGAEEWVSELEHN